MASDCRICSENFNEFVDIDVHMEVKCEHDSDLEASSPDDLNVGDQELNLEFIIPEKHKPEEIVQEGSDVPWEKIESEFLPDDSETENCSSNDDDIEDEPEVSESYLKIIS